MAERKARPGIVAYLSPVLVVLLLGALSQVEPEIPTVHVAQPEIELRDRFLSAVARGDLFWLVGKNGKIARSDNAGESWQVQHAPVQVNWQDIAAWDDNHAVVVGNDGMGAVTADGGANWEPVELPVSDIAGKVFRVVIDPRGVAWAAAEVGVLMYSQDRGVTWSRADVPEQDVAWNDLAFLQDGTVCAVGEFGRILCRFADSDAWEEPQSPIEESLMAVDFAPDGRGVAVGVNGVMIQTRDGGETWTRVPELTDRHLFDVLWDGERWVVVGDKGALLTGRPATGWEVDRVSRMDFAWHTAVIRLPEGYLIAGQTTGIWRSGSWRPFLQRG